ncbi:hypothetical protein [Pseudogracilibacillus auburnensis]|uniref:hypothetical protein n=1 Tax=Pseudogracilibacillus auburnensis TaxID=1494959 RepID=UPI001A95C788|nr:hypothetical protein [Pseudogracilibacillus auburnensis]MBO1003873.1 hypothetical protein [Pseudogracilibacillus auburnensis]
MPKISNDQLYTQRSIYSYTRNDDKPSKNKFNNVHPANAHVSISENAKRQYKIAALADENDELLASFQSFYQEFMSAEAIEKRRLEQMENEQSFNQLESKFAVEGVHYVFPEGTLQHTITKALEGKVKNASLYASELASAIRGSISMPEKSVEERSAYREMALRQAEFIADNYFESEEEAKAFMDELLEYAENDLLREKGYIVIDHSDMKPFKAYSSPNAKHDEVSLSTIAKRYVDNDYVERMINGKGTPEETRQLLMQIQQHKKKYQNGILSEFVKNERDAINQINSGKEMVKNLEWVDGYVSNNAETDQSDILTALIKWNENMLNLFY